MSLKERGEKKKKKKKGKEGGRKFFAMGSPILITTHRSKGRIREKGRGKRGKGGGEGKGGKVIGLTPVRWALFTEGKRKKGEGGGGGGKGKGEKILNRLIPDYFYSLLNVA